MKIKDINSIEDCDLYFAVAIILAAFGKISFAVFAFVLGLMCCIMKEIVRKIGGGK